MRYVNAGDTQWEATASSLRIGASVRVVHCGRSLSAIISRKPGMINLHCFKCGENKTRPDRATLSEIANPPPSSTASKLLLPRDLTSHLSQDALLWLSKYGVSRDTAKLLHFASSRITRRLYMPLLSHGSWIAYQARALNGQLPKYLNSSGIAGIGSVFVGGIHTSSTLVLVVEDILSALRVGRLYNAFSTLGTALSPEKLSMCLTVFGRKTFVLWLDPDKAGIVGRRKMAVKLRMQGLEVRFITSAKDPKDYTDAEVAQFVTEAMETPTKC